jgi:hypothetical protein
MLTAAMAAVVSSERERGNADVRVLAAWFEIP